MQSVQTEASAVLVIQLLIIDIRKAGDPGELEVAVSVHVCRVVSPEISSGKFPEISQNLFQSFQKFPVSGNFCFPKISGNFY